MSFTYIGQTKQSFSIYFKESLKFLENRNSIKNSCRFSSFRFVCIVRISKIVTNSFHTQRLLSILLRKLSWKLSFFFFTNNEMVSSFFFFEIFPVASLLSCLHNLRQENMRLEDHVASLNRRREHLLAVNARLSIPLSVQPSSHSYSGNSASLSDRSTPGRL